MVYLLYPGCMIVSEQYQYEISAKKILDFFGIEYRDFPEFHCCGEPMKCVNVMTWLTMAARIIAIAERENADILVLCNGCYLSLNKAKKILLEDSKKRDRVNAILGEEDLEFRGRAKIKHIMSVIAEEIGEEKIRDNIKIRLDGLKFATHYGCHVLRPYEFAIDDPENPTVLEKFIELLGGSAPYYPERMDCCMILFSNVKPRDADMLRGEKLEAIKKRGFHAMVTICPLCQHSYETRQKRIMKILKMDVSIPVIYYTQLLGLSLGMGPDELGLNLNSSPVEKILEKIATLSSRDKT